MRFDADYLLNMLPSVYREKDAAGDIKAFLSIPAISIEEIRALIDGFSSIFDVDSCDARFLPLIGALVGYDYDPLGDPESQRREIREAIDYYRRKGTASAITGTLTTRGWSGTVDETYLHILRLNKRGTLNNAKLAGQIFSTGACRIKSSNVVDGIRDILTDNTPAGVRVFFIQWLRSLGYSEVDIAVSVGLSITIAEFMTTDSTFKLGSSCLNSGEHLTTTLSTISDWAYII